MLNRLCDPESKLGIFRWLEDVHLPGWELPRGWRKNSTRRMRSEPIPPRRRSFDLVASKRDRRDGCHHGARLTRWPHCAAQLIVDMNLGDFAGFSS